MNLPLFELTIDDNEDSGVDFIALVKSPAIELEWQAFNAEVKIIVCKNCGHSWDIADGGDKPYMCKCGTDNEEFIIDQESKFAFKADKEKKIISGAAMIPNIPILRKREDGELYNVFFKPKTIEKIVERFFKHDYTKNFNKSHSSEIAEGVYMIESFIINSERGIMTPKGYDKVPDGTWWISCKVENEEIWQDFIKTGEFKGFSVEGIFKHSKSQDDEIVEALLELITN
jgi:hypothetical protein